MWVERIYLSEEAEVTGGRFDDMCKDAEVSDDGQRSSEADAKDVESRT